jgi:MFS transporter, CP family, cyanate transporter
VVLGGVAAAVHVGKLPPAIPVLRDALGISLLEAGFLLSMVQLAGMSLGIVAGLVADAAGLRRTMVLGLVLTGAASIAGGWAGSPALLLGLRGLEGLGFLLACMPAPALIRRLVPAGQMSAMLGWWGAYMPFATAAALLAGPGFIVRAGWAWWWWALGSLTLLAAAVLAVTLPPDPSRPARTQTGLDWRARVVDTLKAPAAWLVALAFGFYSAQWLAVIGFLPAIYHAAGVPAGLAAWGTAAAAAVNMSGNIASGRWMQSGARPHHLLLTGFATMGFSAAVAFSPWLPDHGAAAWLRYAAVLAFSAVGGLIPGTLFSLAVRAAPGEHAVATTVGWMQQWSALGQFTGPPLVAWLAQRTGGWSWSWLATGAFALAGVGLALAAARLPRLQGASRQGPAT